MKARYIPNILSISRIFFGLAFLPLGYFKLMPWFLACFVLAGVSDVLDGILARKFDWQSELGEKLDSAADGVYVFAAIFTVIFTVENLKIALYCYVIFGLLLLGRAVNMIFTWVKFRRVGFIHTRSSRWASVPMFALLPLSVYLGYIPNIPLAVFLVLTTIAQLEETWILHIMRPGEYTMSLKSYWEWKRDREKALAAEANAAEQERETIPA